MSWDYRLLRYKDGALGLHEVQYNSKGEPKGCTEHPTGLVADGVEDMREVFNMAKTALDKPVLEYDKIGK